MKFGELNAHEKSVAYGDTLLNLFPNYKNKDFLLESMGSACDIYIEPRDTSKIRFYYEQLLKEKNVPEAKKKDIRARLNRIDLTFDEYILKINSQLQQFFIIKNLTNSVTDAIAADVQKYMAKLQTFEWACIKINSFCSKSDDS